MTKDTRDIECSVCQAKITVIIGMAADRYELCNPCFWVQFNQ